MVSLTGQPIPLLLSLLLLTASCRQDTFTPFEITAYPLPAEQGEGLRLFSNEQGTVYASWIERDSQDAYRFLFTTFQGNHWTEPVLIAAGDDQWFVNWADMPRLAQYKGDPSALAALWLKKSSRHPYDHHILISQSMDKGKTWSVPFMPYDVRTPAFYGLCHLLPTSDGQMMAVWEDGRETVIEIPQTGRTVPNFKGRIALKAVEFDKTGKLSNPAQLDGMISELCPFDVTESSGEPLVVYRNATRENIRDVAITRNTGGNWTTPNIIFEDNWQVRYYTMQGPATDALSDQVAVAWYSNPAGDPQVKVIFSKDGGETFSQPVRIDNGHPLGKVDVVFWEEDRVLVCWVEQEENTARLFVAEVSPRGRIGQKQAIAEVSEKIYAGFPTLSIAQNGALLAWKESEATFSRLNAVLIQH